MKSHTFQNEGRDVRDQDTRHAQPSTARPPLPFSILTK
jgi:hypothetical protein